MSFQFSAHGDYQILVKNNVLVVRLVGSWNKECAFNFAQEIKVAIQLLSQNPWGLLLYLDDWDLGVPEMTPIIKEWVDWSISNGLEKSAQVYCESSTKKYSLDKMVIDKTASFERQIFIDEISALNWLKSFGFTLASYNSGTETQIRV